MLLASMRKGPWSRHAVIAIAIILGLAVLGGTCGWLLRNELVKRDREASSETRYMRTLLSAHRIFALDPPSGVTLPAREVERLACEIGRRLGATMRLPTAEGWPLVFRGGRLLPLGSKPAALLVFERGEDHVSLIVLRDDRALAVFNRPLENTSVSLAREGNFQVGVVGKVSPDEFTVLKQILGRSQAEN